MPISAAPTPDSRPPDRDRALTELDRALAERPSVPVLVDFDHTLLRTNATEAFLASARPRRLAALVLWLIDIVKPWRLLPARGDREFAWRDVLRLRALLLLCPGVMRRWQETGAAALADRIDPDLHARLADRGACVVTHGFTPIVAPILTAAGLTEAAGWRLVAMPIRGGARARDAGKAARLADRRDIGDPATALLITDDPVADAELIGAVAAVVTWPPAPPLPPAFDDFYLPFRYILRVKRPGQGHMRTVVVGEDAMVLILAGVGAAGALGWLVPAVVLLVLSFIAIYEIGYAENDRVGRRVERKPIIPSGWDIWSSDTIGRWNWIAALVLAVPGLALLAAGGVAAGPIGLPGPVWLGLSVGWLILLAVQRVTFAIFNRLRPVWRMGPFVLLQALKSLGFALALGLAVTPVGLVLMGAHVVSRSIPYAIYRCGGPRWVTPDQTIRLACFAAGAGTLAALAGPAALGPWQAVALIGFWCLVKARWELGRLVGLSGRATDARF